MRRLMLLAALSAMAVLVAAPAALAQQQGGGLCPGAQAVTSLSGSASDGDVESEEFDVSTDLFQVAVDNTSNDPEADGSTYVAVGRPGFTRFEDMNFGDGEDGVFNVANTGNGPFTVRASSTLQSYDITVYECPNGAVPEQTEPTATTPEPTETTAAPTTPETTPTPDTTEMTAEPPDTTEMTAEPTTSQPEPTTTTPETTAAPTTPESTGTDGNGGMGVLPDTGGPAFLLPVAGLLLASGILGFAVVRRRS